MLDAVISFAVQHGGNDLALNNNEAVDVGMEEDPEKILPKYVGRKHLFFFLFVKETRRAGRESGQFS
jgi:hypothetical protein